MSDNINESLTQVAETRKQYVEKYNSNKKKVSSLLNKYQEQIAKALPRFMNAQTVIQASLTCMMKKPELMECTSHSLISCILTASQLGLMFDDFLGEAYLLPFNNNKKKIKEAQFVPGYRGLVTLARRSGQVLSVKANLVYKNEFFEWEEGLEPKLVHKPIRSAKMEDDDMVYAYAVIKYVNGGNEFIVLSRDEILHVRDESKNYKFSKNKAETVWATSFPSMAKKTALRQLMKLAPLSPEISRAISLDEAADMGMQNIAADMVGDLPEFTEDVDAELVEESQAEQHEAEQQRDQYNQDLASDKAARATSATLDTINRKIPPRKQ